MAASSARIPVDPIEGLHVLGLAVAGLALLVVGFAVGARLAGERPGGRRRDRRTRAERAQELTPTQRSLRFFFHLLPSVFSPTLAPLTTATREPRSRCR